MQLSQYHLELMTCNNTDLIWTERNEILMIQYLSIFITLVLLTNVALPILIMFLRRFPQYLTVACLALSLLLSRSSFFMLPFFKDMTNAFPQQLDDPTKSSVSLIIPTQPTPIVSFTPAMPSSLQSAPTHSLVGPSQVQTKPPTVQPPSSPTPVTLFVNNQKNRKLPHNQSSRQINQTTSRPPTSGHMTFHSGTTEQGQYYVCVRNFETVDWALCIDASCAIIEKSEATPKTYGTFTPQQLAREKKDAHSTTRSSDSANDPSKSCAYRLIYRRVETGLVTKDELTAVKRDSE
ncbi:hypothetical protein BLNAU_24692 [Blattamonas nauphoetae]|uniref:Uncharacterized protein n=1 Tax=Blattamonas nauphoetae TaxID=2049346 RepID=A0ABQ9WM41_9EUKA|nr:hypothetical protein BLNAU_24692 [Blattamonas nauphoetae]